MALTTYAELQSSIADLLNRQDLASAIPTFISLAEAQISRDVRHWQMENRATATLRNQYLTRPYDWVETIRLVILGNGTKPLEFLSSAAMDDRRSNSNDVAGEPKYYRHIENQFEVFPTPAENTSAELVYVQKIPALSNTATSNWLLSAAPDVYLYGALIHSAPYLDEDARVAVWAQLYSAAVLRLNNESDTSKYSGSSLSMRVKGLDTSKSANYWVDR